jgi:hypothetical protein
MSEDIKKLVLDKRKEGKIVVMGIEGPMSMNIKEFIKQPVDGILYDLNRLEETALTFIDDPKWVNDFAVALTIRELYGLIESLREVVGIAAHPDAYENWEAMLADAISALPSWILENE